MILTENVRKKLAINHINCICDNLASRVEFYKNQKKKIFKKRFLRFIQSTEYDIFNEILEELTRFIKHVNDQN